MKLDAARIVLRPRSLSEILDLALRFMTGPAARTYAKLGALTLLPAWCLCVAARYGLGWEWGWVWVLALGLATPIQGVFAVAIGQMMFAEELGAKQIFAQFFRRLPAYLGVLLITRAMLAAACLLGFLIIPPLWVWARCAYVHEVCLLEQASAKGALERAGRMVRHNITGTAGLLLLMSLAALGFVLVSELLLNYGLLDFVLQVGRPFGALFDELGSAPAVLGLLLAVPFWVTARFLAYVDLRTRRDGWDVQLRFMAIAAAAQAEQAESRQPGSGPAEVRA